MKTARIGIVGIGPRGLTLLERIVAHERVQKSADLEVYLFDPNPPGIGCHDPNQEDFLLVNTVAGQITQFSDGSVIGAGPILEGPSFYQWLADDHLSKLGPHRVQKPVSPDAYYSRALFGRYLHWVYHYLVALAPAHVKINLVRESVAAADHLSDGAWLLSTTGASYCVDYLHLTTGHTKPATGTDRTQVGATTVVSDPYPVRQKLDFIAAGSSVAIEGLGLTTFDIVAQLTTGRGGRFVESAGGNLRYEPSGFEPKLLAYSRSGLPLTARARNQKGVSIQYKARFLVAERVRALRATRKLDFLADIFPLLWADMQYAYYEAYLRERRDPVSAMLFCNQFVYADAQEREALIQQYVLPEDHLCLDRLANPIPDEALDDATTFGDWLKGYLLDDVKEARRGNVDGPLKAACDVVRDVRDNLRAAIDFGGLTEASHRWLMSDFVPFMNRIAVGPPVSRITEMLALMEAGVLDIGFGPGARCEASSPTGPLCLTSALWPERWAPVDVLVKARVSMHSPGQDASPLLRGLLNDGFVRLFHNGGFHPGGIEVSADFNWVSIDGSIVDNAWALGIPTEGAKFYTFVVPRSGVNSTAIVDAGRAVRKMLSLIGGREVSQPVDTFEISAPTTEYASAFASLYGAL